MAYNKESQARYKKKIVQYSIKYSLQEQTESSRLKAYLEHSGQSANSYIKGLIKADLDSKGFNVDGNIDNWLHNTIYMPL